ncbi:Pro-Pol polyprotein [Folsomia candida]|uniref:Pro-Pol polyprotein n=1 Tax=Folsomia candida TaxID=158441 RepID=A0A226EXC4_FOLCA|nr:Pro-Pol polyprotein [Folsomia candida]
MDKAEIQRTWLDSSEPGSFSSIRTFIKNQPRFKNPQDVKEALLSLEAASIHQGTPRRKTFPRVISGFPGFCFASDLIDYSKLKNSNRKFAYCLVICDIFSKMCYLRPIKRKSAVDIVEALRSVFKKHGAPWYIWWDREKATGSALYIKFMKDNNVKSYATFSPRKSAFAERKIRDIKARFQRIFTERKRNVWIDKVDEVEKSLNSTYHSRIKRRPIDVTNDNAGEVYQTLFDDVIRNFDKIPKPKLKVGDYCRVARTKLIFEKG